MEPIRSFLRHKKASVKYYEAEATKIDYEKRIVYINDESEIKGSVSSTEVPFDMLVVGVGAENATFGEQITDWQNIRHGLTTQSRYPRCPRTRSFLEGSQRCSGYPQTHHGLL